VSGRYLHPLAGFSLSAPTSFLLLEQESDRAVLCLEAPGRPTLIATVEPVPSDAEVEELTSAGLEALAGELLAFHLLDRAPAWVGEWPCVRTLAHHVADGQGMALEQWRLAVKGRGFTLTGSCPTLDYPRAAAVLCEAAESFRL